MKYLLDIAPSVVKEARKVYLYREREPDPGARLNQQCQ